MTNNNTTYKQALSPYRPSGVPDKLREFMGCSFASLPYIPNMVSKYAMMAYLMAALGCMMLYSSHFMTWYWWLFGLIEVCGFFYFANQLSKAWLKAGPMTFAKNIFWTAFILRALWVVISFVLYNDWTGTPFSIGAGDELFYDEVAHYAARLMREGNWHIYSNIERYAGGVKFSDMGYPIYLSIVYWLFGDSIFLARIIKAALGAWTALLMYKLAVRNFGETTGRMVGIMCALMPTLIYYCSFQLKEIEMVFLGILFIERADHLLRKGKLPVFQTAALMLIPLALFMIRTALAATLVMAFFCALLFSSDRVVKTGQRIMLIVAAVAFAIVMFLSSTSIGNDVREMWARGGSQQKSTMEWHSTRKDARGFNNEFAKYAGAAVFAPMIFTIPFPTMTDTAGQENQKLIHGGNFVKNITSYFTIFALLILLLTGDWRKYVLPVAVLVGYLVVLVFSNFAHSERFHQPILPLSLMFAAYGISLMPQVRLIKKYFPYWCLLMLFVAIAWNWFKLAGRGMI